MTSRPVLVCAAILTAITSQSISGAWAGEKATKGETPAPVSGQAGKDVVWIGTPQSLVERMLDMAQLRRSDYLVDLGSGDGRLVISAAKRGARAHGIEYEPDLVALAKRNAEREKVSARATFVQADIFQSDFSDASVVTLFLLPELNLKLRPTLLSMKPGTRIVSNSFDMGDWAPDETFFAPGPCEAWCSARKWVVPASVGGDWRLGADQLSLVQTYQMLDGTLTKNGKSLPISSGKVLGAEIVFTSDGVRYTGKFDGLILGGKTESGENWTASRVQ